MLAAAGVFKFFRKQAHPSVTQTDATLKSNEASQLPLATQSPLVQKNRATTEKQATSSRFPRSFLTVREEAIRNAEHSLNQAEAAITDFGDTGLNQRVMDYQKLSRDFFDAVKGDDQSKIRQLAMRQADAFPAMTKLVAPLSVANRDKFNKYFFAIGPAWADLLQACAGADLPSKDSPPAYPSGSDDSPNSSPASP
jgi:hypothetical protein